MNKKIKWPLNKGEYSSIRAEEEAEKKQRGAYF